MPAPKGEPPPDHGRRPWIMAMLGDVQFWVPVAALIGGLLVLAWVR
ncbi:MAG TPA: hypothetical protein VEI06_16605 [Gemmatimonadaceae bacterium]|nr:hypothetical protein [Gemmatimonadaceae bacterium]